MLTIYKYRISIETYLRFLNLTWFFTYNFHLLLQRSYFTIPEYFQLRLNRIEYCVGPSLYSLVS